VSWERLGEHGSHHLVSGETPQLDGSMLHVVFEEVPLHTVVFGLFANQGILGIRNGALLVVLPLVEDLLHELPEVESLLGGVSRRLVLGFTRGLSHTSLLFGLVVDGPASESEEVARTILAGAAVVCSVSVGEACELDTVVRAAPNVRHMSMVPWRNRRTFF
jgi:hypothetical protein